MKNILNKTNMMNDFATTSLLPSLLLGGAVALVHAMLQLSVSVITLLSGHSLGARRSQARLLRLNTGYVLGAACATATLLLASSFVMTQLSSRVINRTLWIEIAAVSILSSLLIVQFYYRKSAGTLLWIPRDLADYLTKRAKKTRNVFEAGSLGIVTTLMELPFAISLVLIAGFIVALSPIQYQFLIIAGYTLLSVLPLIVITVMLGAGHRLSTIQRWREQHKRFLQYASSFGLLSISLYIVLFYIRSSQ